MWRIYITVAGREYFVAEYATANLARWWMYAWLDRGFFPVAHTGTEEYVAMVGSPGFQMAHFRNEGGPTPVQTLNPEFKMQIQSHTSL